MILLLVSARDPASRTLRDAALRAATWTPPEETAGAVVRRFGDLALAEISELHLDAAGVDSRLAEALGPIDAVLVLSKHRSESAKPTLTTHPVGNWGPEAKFGGAPRSLSPPAPHLMSAVLAELAASPAGYAVSFEATHHGPRLEVPTAYVELGSSERAWEDPVGADAVVGAVLRAVARPAEGPVLLGVGGGHYAPRFTDLARRREVVFGHILPAYALAVVDDATLREAARGHDAFVVDPRGAPPELRDVTERLGRLLPQRGS